jgi:hypothetical protein
MTCVFLNWLAERAISRWWRHWVIQPAALKAGITTERLTLDTVPF